MYRDIVDWSTSKMSAHTSSIMFCALISHTVSSGSRAVNASRGHPPLSMALRAIRPRDITQLVKLLSIQS